MNPNQVQFLKCKSCSGPVTILDSYCPYCGDHILVNRILPDQAKDRMAWMGSVLETKIWKKKFILLEKMILKIGLSVLFIEIFLFWLFYSISGSSWKPLLAILPISISICAAYYIELHYYFEGYAENSVYQKYIEPIINEFLIGNNYYKAELESVLNSIEDSKVSFIKRMMFPVIDQIPEKDSISRIVLYHTLLCDKNRFHHSAFRCGMVYVLLSFVFGIITFLLLLYIDSYLLLLILLPLPWIFLILEYTEKTDFVFGLLDYNPSKDFIEKELRPSIKRYCEQTGISIQEIITKSKDLNQSLHFYL